jgi:hypothetical protein
MAGNHIPMLPYALIEMHSVGLFGEKQDVGIIKDFEILTTAELQTKTAQQIIQHVAIVLPHHRYKKMAIVWISEHAGIIYIGDTPETQIEYGFHIRYTSIERNG